MNDKETPDTLSEDNLPDSAFQSGFFESHPDPSELNDLFPEEAPVKQEKTKKKKGEWIYRPVETPEAFPAVPEIPPDEVAQALEPDGTLIRIGGLSQEAREAIAKRKKRL